MWGESLRFQNPGQIYMCVYIHTKAHVSVCVCIYTFIYVHIYIHTCIYTYIYSQQHTRIHTQIQQQTHTRTHTQIHAEDTHCFSPSHQCDMVLQTKLYLLRYPTFFFFLVVCTFHHTHAFCVCACAYTTCRQTQHLSPHTHILSYTPFTIHKYFVFVPVCTHSRTPTHKHTLCLTFSLM